MRLNTSCSDDDRAVDADERAGAGAAGLAAEQLGLSSELIHMADPASDPDRKAFNKRLKGIATALQKQGWGEEAAMTQWCEILAAPLIRRQALLDEAGHGNGTRN